MRIGLIGFGTIGRAVARAVDDGRAGDIDLGAVLIRKPSKAKTDEAQRLRERITSDPDRFFATEMKVVVDVAGHAALKQYAERVLRSGRDLMTVSVGAFADENFLSMVKRAVDESGQKLLIPSGALGGLDTISSGAMGELDEVTLLVRKPPAAWKGTPAEEAAMNVTDQPVCVYEGNVREAAALFPQNVNVAAALSLAGIGFDRTSIQICADPTIKHNILELHARGEFGELKLEIKNRPYPENPKTGHLVVMSVIKAIRRLQDKVIVGF